MRIIIIGCGKVGYTIAKNLSAERSTNVIIIDNKAEAFEKAQETMDAIFVKGNGLSADRLIEAGVRDTDLVISVTNADETNVLACILAKRLGAKRTIARVREPEYASDLNKFWVDLGLDMIINPEQQTAREISRVLRFPTADDIDTFVSGRVELVSFKVSEAHDFFVGKSVKEIFSKKNMEILLATVERDGSVLMPHGDLVFQKDDVIRVIGRPSNIMNFFIFVGKNTSRIKDVVIIGGGKIAYYLISLLNRHSSATKIKIIEKDRAKCEALSESFPRCLIIHGDGTDEEFFSSGDIDKTGAVACLTDRDEENAIMALYSLELGVRKIIVKIDHINRNMVKNLGLGSVVSTKNVTSEQIIRYVRGLTHAQGNNIRTLYKIFDSDTDKVEAIEFNALSAKANYLDRPLKNLRLKKEVLVGCIVRGSNIIIPTGEVSIKYGDNVVIFVKNKNILRLDDILE